MSTVARPAKIPRARPASAVRERTINTAEKVLMAIMVFYYGGGGPYLGILSNVVLYGFYAIQIVCIMLCWPRTRVESRANLRALRPIIYWLLAFEVYISVISVMNISPPDALYMVFRDVVRTTLLWGSLCTLLANRDRVGFFAGGVSISILFNSIVSYLSTVIPAVYLFVHQASETGDVARQAQYTRAAGLWGNANQAGHAFLFACFLAVWAKPIYRWITWISSVPAIYLSASRQASYLLVVATFYAWWRQTIESFKARRPLKVVGLLLVVFIILIVVPEAISSLGSGDSAYSQNFSRVINLDTASNQRLEVAEIALNHIDQTPWYGAGAYMFRQFLIPIPGAHGAHNLYLVIWGEAGIPMLALYIVVMLYGFVRTLRVRLPINEKVSLVLMWISWLMIGFSWHEQFADFDGLIFLGLIYMLPAALVRNTQNAPARQT